MKRHYQVIFEAILSILIIVDLLIMSLMIGGFAVGIMHSSVASVGRFDLLVAILILLDFVIFRVRKEKTNGGNLQFIRQNWAYIVSIIPITFLSFDILQLYGFMDILWLLVLLRFYALIKVLVITGSKVREYPSKTKLDYATVILLLVLIIGSFIFFIVERTVNPEVPNYESAVWFSIISMTTVGYGDIVPVTLIGRMLGVIIILTGMGYVSLVTATLAYSFIDLFRKESGKAVKKVEKRVINYEDKIDELLIKVEELDTKIDDIKNKKKE
jgi:voltage-gated potassium channel